ncbi:DUF222 domain-containing protein [Blastococcus sp. SYSU D00922]
MFDPLPSSSAGAASAVEERLRDRLEGRPQRIDLLIPRRAVLVDLPQRPVAVEPEGGRLAALLEAGALQLAGAKAAQRRASREAAVQARAVAAFARARPAAELDRPDTEVGAAAAATRAARPAELTAVSEWAVDEVMAALGLSAQAASALLVESVTLVEQLPATLAALEAGVITPAHARMLTEVLSPIADDGIRAEVEAGVLARAAGRTVAALRVAAKRAVLRADASAAARRLAAAVRDRAVRVQPGEDGMATLSAGMPLPVARACYRALEAYAADCATPDDARSKDQRMVDCLADLILRPDAERPPVQAQLTVVATVGTLTGGNEPGEVDGQPVPALLVRELAHALGLLPRPEAADAAPVAPRPSDGMPELLGLPSVAGTALAEPPQIAVVDDLSGQLLALASPTEIRRAATCDRPACRTGRAPCTHRPVTAGLGPPSPVDRYRPSDAMQRFVRARDRRCRFPGCRIPAARCDLDHNRPWPAGATSCDNLCCLCRHHHRLSHQAPGWSMRRLPDGGLEWTTPSGERITTHPPRYGTDDRPPPQQAPPQRLTLRERALGRPPRPGDEPAPF